MVDRIRWDTVSYLPFYYVFFQFLLLTIFNLQANILTTKDILSNLEYLLCGKENRLVGMYRRPQYCLRSHAGKAREAACRWLKPGFRFAHDITNGGCTEGKLVLLRE